MTVKYTPGPWFFEDEGDFDYENVRITSASRTRMISIAIIEYGSTESCMDEPFQSEQIANTHLITAAPELLETLQKVEAFWLLKISELGCLSSEAHAALDSVQTAIAKATGGK